MSFIHLQLPGPPLLFCCSSLAKPQRAGLTPILCLFCTCIHAIETNRAKHTSKQNCNAAHQLYIFLVFSFSHSTTWQFHTFLSFFVWLHLSHSHFHPMTFFIEKRKEPERSPANSLHHINQRSSTGSHVSSAFPPNSIRPLSKTSTSLNSSLFTGSFPLAQSHALFLFSQEQTTKHSLDPHWLFWLQSYFSAPC